MNSTVRWRRRPVAARENQLVRVIILSVVFVLHIVAAMLLPDVGNKSAKADTTSALRVRFIKTLANPGPSSQQTSVFRPSALPPPTKRRINRSIGLPPITAANRVQPATDQAIPSAVPMPPRDRTYVPGGQMLGGEAKMDPLKSRLPGVESIKGAPRFEMVDPKTQGFGVGVIRFIGAFTGAVDPHCVDLEAWRGMTTDERIKHGVSDKDIERLEQNYNCDARQLRRPQ